MEATTLQGASEEYSIASEASQDGELVGLSQGANLCTQSMDRLDQIGRINVRNSNSKLP